MADTSPSSKNSFLLSAGEGMGMLTGGLGVLVTLLQGVPDIYNWITQKTPLEAGAAVLGTLMAAGGYKGAEYCRRALGPDESSISSGGVLAGVFATAAIVGTVFALADAGHSAPPKLTSGRALAAETTPTAP